MTDQTWRRGWQDMRLKILERDGWRCQLCGRPAKAVDHILPRSRGGDGDPSNLRAICGPCNSRKGARLTRKRRPPRADTSRWP